METNLSGIRYRLLGPVEALIGEGSVDIGGRKRRTVLAALLLQPNTVVPDERLIDLVWGEDPPRSARSQIHGHVHELRKRLGADTIVRQSFGYRLLVGAEAVDVALFERLLDQARAGHAAGRLDDAARDLRAAVSLWTGPALSGVEPALVTHLRPALEEERLNALEALYEVEVERGRALDAIPKLRTLCAEHPTRERFAGLLMSALHSRGRAGEALEVYAELRDLLRVRVGVEPSAPVQRLHRELTSTRGVVTGHAEDPPGQRSETPPRVRPAELPRCAHGIVGRASELGALDAELNGRPAPFLLVTGVAGVGKTTLAAHWGHEIRDRFPDGQLYVDLDGSGRRGGPVDSDDALRQLLRSLGTDPRHLPSGSPDLAKLFRSITADLRLLVLFDDAASVEQVSPLLPGGRSNTVLVTSRHELVSMVALFDARRVHLNVLSEKSSIELLQLVAGPETLAAARESSEGIVDHCGRLPLALRMAAARMGSA
ncbi:AfsR/SARP family transcriptional regulator [Nocardiopsis sp. L17-MgMaSL7]|uniref:AfsR/SARP family transcriptional regulator n=1 Tax=Nocardiopsis sp. L17-MgMaSL7 TaxID=1938893 RepID=UPI000D98D9BF|nr:AfsR/SARP family transcriptional regulator [Nocardiopsis sp. L17-MgMaSL7]PWV45681.1 DNA-binding SARP family transcriptional activator [Nocardiopsis sp. L17-MgMaSL7]